MPRNANRLVSHLTVEETTKRNSFRFNNSIRHRATYITGNRYDASEFFTTADFPRRSGVFVCQRPSIKAQTTQNVTNPVSLCTYESRSPYPVKRVSRYFI